MDWGMAKDVNTVPCPSNKLPAKIPSLYFLRMNNITDYNGTINERALGYSVS